MFFTSVWSVLVVAFAVAICVCVVPEGLARRLARWRLAAPTLLIAVATLSVLYLPPYAAVTEPQVLMMGLVAAVLGLVRGALLDLKVDHGTGQLLLRRAREGALVAIVAALLMLADVAATVTGEVGLPFAPAIELGLLVLASFLVGRNATVLLRSRDAPHEDF
ncbi:hypothetical protein BH11PSE3_BH11PSE3_28210 [soil metagenome]